jgi:adenylate cyclase
MPQINMQAIVDWLIDGARTARRPEDVLAELCAGMVTAGLPLWRVAVFVRTLHPEVMGRRFLWRPGHDVEMLSAGYEIFDEESFQRSPVVRIYETGVALRRRIDDPATADDFPFLAELRAEGVTDYFAVPLRFANGENHAVTWTTRAPGGFADAHIAAIEAIMKPFTRVAEIWALRRTATSLLNTYVGTHAGERIMSGRIRRGDVEAIHAAIWFSDMRGFTGLADRLPARTLVDVLNRYFDCQVPVIAAHGGEVLKFIGDGLLAIFPVNDDESDAEWVCEDVLVAAREVRTKLAALRGANDVREAADVRFGLALHLGEVLYGNIGGGDRLDFTCIGPAVNLAARIERLTRRLDRSVLTSTRFARHCPTSVAAVGEFTLTGFANPQMVYGFSDEAAAAPA